MDCVDGFLFAPSGSGVCAETGGRSSQHATFLEAGQRRWLLGRLPSISIPSSQTRCPDICCYLAQISVQLPPSPPRACHGAMPGQRTRRHQTRAEQSIWPRRLRHARARRRTRTMRGGGALRADDWHLAADAGPQRPVAPPDRAR